VVSELLLLKIHRNRIAFMKTLSRIAFFCCLLLSIGRTHAQTAVPALIGLSVPEAAAQLNRAGLRLGEVGWVDWSENTQTLPNTVESQSIAAGETVEPGAAVEITVWRAEKAVVIFDDNDITLINPNSVELSLRRVWFRSLDGEQLTEFDATEWANRLRPNECLQLWSVERVAGKEVEGCPGTTRWISRTVPGAHFWTGANGTTEFEVVQDRVQRGVCEIDAGRCEFYLAPSTTRGGISPDVSEYVYLRYTTDWLQLYNRAADRWLPAADLKIGSIDVGWVEQYTIRMEVASPVLLAPGQCLIWSNDSSAQGEACDVVAAATTEVFWTAPFNVESAVNGMARACPAAEAGAVTVCLLPRLENPQ
jgi:hypothetical protein